MFHYFTTALLIVIIGGLLRIDHHLRRLRMTATDIQSALDEVNAAIAAEDTEIGQVLAYLTGLPALIAAAIESAQAGGATAAQLAAFDALAADVTAKTADLSSGLAAAPQPAPVTPPAA